MKMFPYSGTGGCGKWMTEWIEQATNGRLKIELAPPGGIVPVADMFDATKKGVLDWAGLYYGGFYTAIIPETDIEIGLPMAWQNLFEYTDGLFNWGIWEELNKVYNTHNIWVMVYPSNDLYHLGSVDPIRTPEDIAGKKARALGVYGKYIDALGGSPVVLPWGELYMALKLGTIDAYLASPTALEDVKLKEVCHYYIVEPNLNAIGCNNLMNLESFNALPDDIRELIERDWYHAQEYYVLDYNIQRMYSFANIVKEYDFELVKWSAADIKRVHTDVCLPLWDEIAAKSPNCKRLVDIVKEQNRALGKID
jgi:TRAP-type C4-dicarboxylate transport system substrate-binding protein